MKSKAVHKLDRVFNPKTIAVIGNREGMGWVWPMKMAALASFQGKLYGVGIDPAEIASVPGLKMEPCASINDIPEPVDQVLSGADSRMAPKITRDAIRKNAGGLVFMTPGFAETNERERVRIQAEIVDMARRSGLNLIGPNCWGIYNPGIGLLQSTGQPIGKSGSVGFVSQSGEYCTALISRGAQNGIKFSKALGYGNAVVVDAEDYLEYLGDDHDTRVIGMYIEGVRDGRRFYNTLREVARRKPVVIWKVGHTAAAARATASHTGALASSSVVWKAMLRQCGAIEVDSLDEMIEVVKMLLFVKPPGGKNVAVITGSGGQMVVITENFAKAGLDVPQLTAQSARKASHIITIGGQNQRNPFDMSSNFTMGKDPLSDLTDLLDIVDKDRNIDCIIFQFSAALLRMRQDPKMASAMIDVISAFMNRTNKSFLVLLTSMVQGGSRGVSRGLMDKGIPAFSSEPGAEALKHVIEYYRFDRARGGREE